MRRFKNSETPDNTIGMLLDIEHFRGESEGRLAPLLITLGIIALPIILYVYYGLFNLIQIPIFVVVEIIVAVRTVMIIPGKESYLLANYRKRLHSEYAEASSLNNIKTVHPDGCVEYTNGKILYVVCTYNNTVTDDVKHSIKVRKFFEALVGDFEFSIFIHNITDASDLNKYYKRMKNFQRNESAANFIKMLDHIKELAEEESLVQCTVYCVEGQRSDWKDIRAQIDSVLHSKLAKCFKEVWILGEPSAISEFTDRNIGTVVQTEKLLTEKYKDGNYGTSRVLKYDLDIDAPTINIQESETKKVNTDTFGFMVKHNDK